MKRWIILLVTILVGAHLLTESASIMAKIWPEVLWRKANLFFTGGYEMEYWWYIKYATDDLLLVATYFVLAKVAYRYSVKLFLVATVFFAYHCIDSWMFWYNFKQSHWLYWALMATLVIALILLVIPIKEKSKYKSII